MLVAIYTLVAVLVTAGYLVLGTTPNRTLAEVTAVIVVTFRQLQWATCCCPP